MAIKGSINYFSQGRVDVSHLRAVESAVRADFDDVLKSLILGENKSYILRGFELNMIGTIGSSANALQMLVAESAILHGTSNIAGTVQVIDSGAPNEVLNSTTNTRVSGSFTPNATNYIGLEFTRVIDNSTAIQQHAWDVNNDTEISKNLPFLQTFDYQIVISSSLFASNVCPIAIVTTDAANNVLSVTDRRPMLFRLGTAGYSAPDPNYVYPWNNQVEGRVENPSTSTSSTSPFRGGDKQILTDKEWRDAIMTEILMMKFGSTPITGKHWMTPVSTSLYQLELSPLMSSSGTFAWNSGTGIITPTQPVTILFPGSAITNTILVASFTGATALASDGDLYYVTLIPGTSGNIAIVKSTVSTFVDADNRYVIATRIGTNVIINLLGNALLNLSNGESSPLVSELTDQILTFIGAASAADYQPNYSSNEVVADNDSLVTAIGKLDTTLGLTRNKVNQKIYIGTAGTGDYTTFALAIAAANDGDTLVFTKGTYAIAADQVVNKQVVIECMGGVIFDGSGGAATKGFQVTHADVIFQLNGALFQDFDTAGDYAIYVEAAGLRCGIYNGRFATTNDGDIFAQPDTELQGNEGSI